MRYCKRVWSIVTVLAMLACLVLPAAASSYDAIAPGQHQTVSMEAGASVILSFTVPEDGTYAFYSDQSEDDDPYGRLLDADMNIISSDDDNGAWGWNFYIPFEAVAGQVYYLEATTINTPYASYDVYLKKMEPATGMELALGGVMDYVGKQYTLECQFYPFPSFPEAVTWTSSNETVATVDENGVVIMVSPGDAVITATSESGFQASCDVTVLDVESLRCGEAATVYAEDNYKVFRFIPEADGWYGYYATGDADTNGELCGSTHNVIQYVDNIGSDRNFMIKEYLFAGENYYLGAGCTGDADFFNVHISPLTPATGLKLSHQSYTGNPGSNFLLAAITTPMLSIPVEAIWTSSNDEVAWVDEFGQVYCCGIGTAIITATSEEGLTASCTVTVEAAPTIRCDKTFTLNAQDGSRRFVFTPETEGWYQFTSMGDAVDTVAALYDENFELLAENDDSGENGNFSLTWYAEAGVTYTLEAYPFLSTAVGEYEVKLSKQPEATSVELSLSEYRGYIGEDLVVEAWLYPLNTTPQTMTWSSSDESVVTVEQDGTVHLVGDGTATVTVTTETGLTAQCFITSIVPVEIECGDQHPCVDEEAFEFVPDADGWYGFRAIDSDCDTYAEVIDVDTGEILAYNDDSTYGLSFYIQLQLTAGKTYYLQAYSYDGETQDTFTVTVNRLQKAESLELLCENGTGYLDDIVTVIPHFLPENSIHEELTWASSDERVVRVSEYSGYVTREGIGTATITATSESGLTAECTITVEDYPQLYCDQPVELDPEEFYTIFNFIPEYDGAYGIYTTGDADTSVEVEMVGYVNFSSDDDSGEDNNFLLRKDMEAGKKYRVICYIQSAHNSGPITLHVSALKDAQQLVFTHPLTYVYEGWRVDPEYQFLPYPAIDEKVTHSSSDESVVASGIYDTLDAVAPGTAEITVTSESGLTAQTTVQVFPVPEGAEDYGSCGNTLLWSLKDGKLTMIGSGAMFNTSGHLNRTFTQVELPEGLTTIGPFELAFTEIETITIPAAVEYIHSHAFYSSHVSSIRFLGSAPEIGEYVFEEVTATVYYPANDPSWTAEVRQSFGGNLTWVPYGEEGEATLSGSITCTAGDVTMELLQGDTVVATITASGSYSFENLPDGAYTLKISKENHVTREYTLTADTKTLDVKLCLLGDVNGDGRVNIGDTARTYSHVKQTATLGDDYALDCADSNGDGRVNIGDTARLYSHVKQTSTLW